MRHLRPESEGMAEWEMGLLSDLGFCQQYLKECKRARNYQKYGLVKLTNLTVCREVRSV